MSDLNIEMQDFMRKIMEQRDAHQSDCASGLAKVRNELLAKGVVTVICEYSGYGDSGGVENVLWHDENNQPVPRSEISDAVHDAVCRYAESLLPMGFENNDGGQGEVILDLKARNYTVNHQENYTETRDSEFEGSF